MKKIFWIFFLLMSQFLYAYHSIDEYWPEETTPYKKIILTKTIDDLVNNGYTKEQVERIKKEYECNGNDLILISKKDDGIVYKKNYPKCWIFKQPFKNIKQNKNDWFMIRYSDHGKMQFFSIIEKLKYKKNDSWGKNVVAIYPKNEGYKLSAHGGAHTIRFFNQCNQKWMNYSITIQQIELGMTYQSKRTILYNLEQFLKVGDSMYNWPHYIVNFDVKLPVSDRKDQVYVKYPFPSSSECKEAYQIERKRVYYKN